MDTAEAAKVFAALGHEGRLLMFRLLASAGPQGLPAGEVARRAGQLQNTTSSSLAVLTNAGLVAPRREGRSIFYAVTPTRVGGALAFLMANFVEDESGEGAAHVLGLLKDWATDGADADARHDRGHDAA